MEGSTNARFCVRPRVDRSATHQAGVSSAVGWGDSGIDEPSMDRRPPGDATSVVNMRIITFGRTVVVPVSLVVLALAGFSAPPVTIRSMLVLLAVGALGLVVLALTRSWRGSSPVRPLTRTDDAVQITKDDASDLARMGSDAG